MISFDNRVLRKTFGLKWEEVTGYWSKLQNKKLHNLCVLPNNIRVIKWKMMRRARHVAFVGKKKNACRVLMWKIERKRPSTFVDGYYMDLKIRMGEVTLD